MTQLRNVGLHELVTHLNEEHSRRLDVIVPASAMHLSVFDQAMEVDVPDVIEDDGVTPAARHRLEVSMVAGEQLGEKLGIPRAYWKRCEEDKGPILASNVNHWLTKPDSGPFYLRTLTGGENGTNGILRACLSPGFHPIDDHDVVIATVAGLQAAGLGFSDIHVSADRSDRRMYLRIDAPRVTVEALDLADRYVDPRSGRSGRDYPLVSAGVIIRNSDVGQGAWTITPRITWLVCKNGMTRSDESMRKVHVGARKDEGVIQWSAETQRKALALIESQTKDAVSQFLSVGYLQSVVDELRGMSRTPIANAQETIKVIAKSLQYSQAEADLILNAFITSGDPSPLGLAQAFTLVAQSDEVTIDRAADLESDAWNAMVLAAKR